MEKYSRIKALISLDAVKYNFEQMKKNIKEGTRIVAVIKADAYGHGAVPIAAMLEKYDYIWGFATATAQEALQLRRAGITRPILILGLVFEEYYEELAKNEVRMAVCDYETACKFNHAAALCGKKALIHLAADTQPGDDRVLPLCVDGRLEDQHPHTALFIVVGNLHQGCGLAAVHRAVAEIQFCHQARSFYSSVVLRRR